MTTADVPSALRQQIRIAARKRCGYCLSPQRYVMSQLEIEHIIPRAQGGNNDVSNLWLSCSLCNRYKGSQTTVTDPISGVSTTLFNPRNQVWKEHFQWSMDGTLIIGISATGRATVVALQLNNEVAVEVRRNWVLAGWHPPEE